MVCFAVGKQVTVLYGKRQGQKGTVLKTQPADVYVVKIEEGTVLFFSGKGLKESNHVDDSNHPGRSDRGA